MKKPNITAYPMRQSVIVDGLSTRQVGEAYEKMIDTLIEYIQANGALDENETYPIEATEWEIDYYQRVKQTLKKAGVL